MSEVANPTPPEITDPTPLDAVVEGDPQDTVAIDTVAGRTQVQRPPLPRDGTITGPIVYSDGHCPLLVDDADVDNRTIVEEHTNQDGTPAGQTVHRYSKVVLTNPTECPTCHKMMERHGLVTIPVLGTRDCAIAIAARANPEYTALFGANAEPLAKQQAVAGKHGLFGKRWLKVFGEKPDPDEMPAVDAAIDAQNGEGGEGNTYIPSREEYVAAGYSPESYDAFIALGRASYTAESVTAAQAGANGDDRKAYELKTLRDARGV